MGNKRLVWWNGDLIHESEARISIYDSALMFGDTVFEMTRSFNKKHFKLREHLERLYASAKYLHIDMPFGIDQLEQAVHETTEANKEAFAEDDECRVMIDVTRGLLSIYEGIEGIKPGVNVIISIFPLRWTVRGMGKLFDMGINLVIPNQRQIPSYLLETKVKNRNRIHYLMANIEASRTGDWPLMLDPDGFVTEGAYNFVMVKGKCLLTPRHNVLQGISRDFVKELGQGSEWIETDIMPYDVYQADEAFITATPFCMLPVVSLNGIKIGDGKPGPLYSLLLRKWALQVNVNIPGQIQKWDIENENFNEGVSPYGFRRAHNG